MKPKRIKYSRFDYPYSSLPTTRKEAFKDVYRHNFRTILYSGLILFLFALPIIIFTIVMEVGKMGMTLEYYSQEQLHDVLMLWDIIINVGVVFLLFIFLIGLSGIIRILRLLIWQQGISFGHDFKRGIKENYPILALLMGIFATIYLATYFIQLFLLQFIIGLTLIIIYLLLFVSTYLWSIFMVAVYQTNLGTYIRNSFFFFGKTIGWTILFAILISLLFISYYLYFISISGTLLFIILKEVFIAILLVFFYPMLLIVGLLYSCSKFDKYINEENYPDYFRRGLYQPKNIK